MAWTDLALTAWMEERTACGVYPHEGRVYIEGCAEILSAGFVGTSDGTLVGTFPVALAPAADVTFDVYTLDISDGPQGAVVRGRVTPAGEFHFEGVLRPDVLIFAGIFHAHWDLDPQPDSPMPQTLGGMSCAPHGERMHLFSTALFDNAGVTDMAYGLSRRMVPLPGTEFRRRVLFYLPKWQVEVRASGEVFPDLGYQNPVAHLTIEAANIGSAADYGSWSGVDFISVEDAIHVAQTGGTDVGAPAFVQVTHHIILNLAPPASTFDVTDPTLIDFTRPGTAMFLQDSGRDTDIYYRYVLEYDGVGTLHKTLYRCDGPGAYTLIGGITEPFSAPGQIVSMGIAAFDAGSWTIDGVTAPAVGFRLFYSNGLFSIVHDSSAAGRAMLTLFPASTGAISPPGVWWNDFGEYQVNYSPATGTIAASPSVGDIFDPVPTDAGWHIAIGEVAFGPIEAGVQRTAERRVVGAALPGPTTAATAATGTAPGAIAAGGAAGGVVRRVDR